MFVAEVFTGTPGQYVPVRETVRGCREILDGMHDDLPEQAFYMVGAIEGAAEKAATLAARPRRSDHGMPLTLQIITPERVVFEEDGVESVTLPGSEGELTVLPRTHR